MRLSLLSDNSFQLLYEQNILNYCMMTSYLVIEMMCKTKSIFHEIIILYTINSNNCNKLVLYILLT